MQCLPGLDAAGCSLVGFARMATAGVGPGSDFTYGVSLGSAFAGATVGVADLLSRPLLQSRGGNDR